VKTILAVLALLVLPAVASAQENYCQAANTSQTLKVERRRLRVNRDTCLRLNAAGGATCSQAQACTAAGAAGGAGCSTAQARAANAEIFANSEAGRTTMIAQTIILPAFVDFDAQAIAEDRAAYCAWWKDPTTTRAAKDLDCNKTTPPRGNDCELCP
jgi:hypothetical protein